MSAALAGVGYAQISVAAFSRAHREAMKRDYQDDIKTYLILSGF